MVGNIHKRPSNVCGNAAVGRSTVGRWADRVRDLEVGKAQLLDVLHQLAEWSQCSGTVLGVIVRDVMRTASIVNLDAYFSTLKKRSVV